MPSPLGDFLRTRRSLVSPEEFGLPVVGRRRVAGLRREEVASLVGMSVDYYIRLEQGRERTPSTQVLDALSDALRLDQDGRLHLFRLAGLAPRSRSGGGADRVDPNLLQLMDGWPNNPTIVLGSTYDVLARNQIGNALFGSFSHSDNLLLNLFLDPVARSFYADWHHAAINTVAGFRLATGANPGSPRVREILHQLEDSGQEFRDIWSRNDARGKGAEIKTLVHQEVGEVILRMQTLDVRSSPGQQLVVFHAEPGSRSADAVALLGSIAVTADRAGSVH